MEATKEVKAKRTRTTVRKGVTLEQLCELPNVDMDAPTATPLRPPLQALMDTVYNAAKKHPEWTFTESGHEHFIVYAKDEELAQLYSTYMRRSGNYIVKLDCFRLDGQDTRRRRRRGVAPVGPAKPTTGSKDAAPILRTFHAHVYPRTLDEVVQEATRELGSPLWRIHRKYDDAHGSGKERLHKLAVGFVMRGGRQAFLAYEAKEGRDTEATMAQIDLDETSALALKCWTDGIGDQAPLVIRRGGPQPGWLVRYNKTTTFYGTEDLPEQYAGVHMLELTTDGTVLTEVGVKVKEGHFLLMPPKNA